MIQNNAQRVFFRGNLATFTVSFYADAANTVPLVPLDIALYPAYTVYDINNTSVQSGVGQQISTPGTWQAKFQVPNDAPLSNDKNRWRIEWSMVTADTRQVSFVEEFDVNDTVVTASENREQSYITLMNQDYRSILRLPVEPVDLGLDVYRGASTSSPIISNAMINGGGINVAVDGDSLIYYYDIPGSFMQPNQVFSMIWKLRYNVAEPYSFVFQSLTSVTPSVLQQVTAVRMLIDKFQKRLNTVQAYEDSAIVEYLIRGQELVNAVYPTTYFGFGNMPQSFGVFVVLFSAWYGLQAQSLLETDLGFNYSGQTVTLDYDHQGPLADIAGRWQEFIAQTLPALKLATLRKNAPVGTVAGRSYRYSDTINFSFKIASISGSTNNIISQLTNLGLLF